MLGNAADEVSESLDVLPDLHFVQRQLLRNDLVISVYFTLASE